MRTFAGAHDDMVNGVGAGTASGEWLSCAEDKLVAITDWSSGRVTQQWRGHERGVARVVPAPHLDGALTCSRDTTVRLWKRGEEAPVATYRGHELSVTAVALPDDGELAVSGSRDYSVRVWDLAAGQCAMRSTVSRNVVTCLAWVGGASKLVAQGSEDLRLRLWDVRSLSQPAAVMEGYIYFPLCCAAQGDYVCTGSNGFDATGCEVRLWDRRTNKQVHELAGHEQAVTGLALLPTAAPGAPLLAATGSKDGEIRLWDLSTSAGTCVAEMRLPTGSGVTGVAAARSDEPAAQLYVSTTTGQVHALTTKAEDGTAALRVVATGGGPDNRV